MKRNAAVLVKEAESRLRLLSDRTALSGKNPKAYVQMQASRGLIAIKRLKKPATASQYPTHDFIRSLASSCNRGAIPHGDALLPSL